MSAYAGVWLLCYVAAFPIFIFFDALDLFLYAYAGVHVLYVAQAGLGVLLKLGRSA